MIWIRVPVSLKDDLELEIKVNCGAIQVVVALSLLFGQRNVMIG